MKNKTLRHGRKISIGILGGLVLLLGIILVPYPGPGWLTVFAGLGILSTEFEWAKRVLSYAKSRYNLWQQWVSKQGVAVKVALWVATAIVVIVTIWLLNGYGIINDVFHLGLDWLRSPLFG